MYEFEAFSKIPRLKRELVITEKLDGTNAHIAIGICDRGDREDPYCLAEQDGLVLYAGSRKRYICPEGTLFNGVKQKGCDNFTFARWAQDNADELFTLGEGRHYGEWYGNGIQRGYELDYKQFALFNTARWGDHNPNTPACCEVTQVLPTGLSPDECLEFLFSNGSLSVPGYMNPEGIVIYHTAARSLFKMTFGTDGKWKGVDGR